jgi:hypothetical protein
VKAVSHLHFLNLPDTPNSFNSLLYSLPPFQYLMP